MVAIAMVGSGLAYADELASTHYRIRGALLPTSSASLGMGGSGTRAVGSSLGSGLTLGKSVGIESGSTLIGGLWPALVGAAFDQDRDLIANAIDNCTERRNTTQHDADDDGYGNPCDADLNQDGVVNFLDLSLLKAAFFSENPAADLNGNGLVNFEDLQLMKAGFFKPPGPSASAGP